MLFQKKVFWEFRNIHGKTPVLSLLLIKLQAFRPAVLLKRDSNTGVPVDIPNFLRAAFFIEHPVVAASGKST